MDLRWSGASSSTRFPQKQTDSVQAAFLSVVISANTLLLLRLYLALKKCLVLDPDNYLSLITGVF